MGEGNVEGGCLQTYSELREESGEVEVSAMKMHGPHSDRVIESWHVRRINARVAASPQRPLSRRRVAGKITPAVPEGSHGPGDVRNCGLMKPRPRVITISFNKPYNVLPSFTDPEGRPTLADYIDLPGVYAAGRLDRDSEGLMLLTSDGALAHRITDPAHKLPKIYLVQVERVPDEEALSKLRRGVLLSGKRTRPAEVRMLELEPSLPDRPVPIRFRKNVPTAWLELTLHEGMNRQVRRMTAAVGHPALRLVRIAIGPITLGDLQPGQWRAVTAQELDRFS